VLVQRNIHVCISYRLILYITQQDYLVILLHSMDIEVGVFTLGINEVESHKEEPFDLKKNVFLRIDLS